MGETIKWKCKCGYTKEIDEAIGFLEYELNPDKEKVWTVSALCSDCSEVVGINRDDENPICTKCNGNKIIPYKNPCLYKADEKKIQINKEKENNDPDRISDDEDEKGITELDLYKIINENNDDDEEQDDGLDLSALDEIDANDDDEYADEHAAEGYYLCPKCNQFLMERFHFGLWD